jgi:hypothetical protein
VFTSLIDKVGADSVLDCLSVGQSQIQQATLTMISMYLNEPNAKVLPEKKLITKLVAIYESTNVTCRSKAYLLTLVLLKQQNDLLVNFVQSKYELENNRTTAMEESLELVKIRWNSPESARFRTNLGEFC